MQTIELKDDKSEARILLIPAYQGRVMTSSANGNAGESFGWINYKLIESGEVSNQFNPVGGEERFWLGPEGGPFSIYFSEGAEQVFSNWVVPPALDTETYDIIEVNSGSVKFAKNTVLKNASGTEFKIGIERTVSLLSQDTLSALFKVNIPEGLDVVAYQTDNTITNTGENAWTKDKGLLSVWLLCMFNPSPTTTVFVPYKPEAKGVIVNDEYFGKVPSDRLIVENGTAYFKIDGKRRSKIGLPPERAKELCGSYDSEKNILTILWCTIPASPVSYVNSKWGKQDNPYKGDVINSYNDGPVEDGSIMGPFYEIETSSPAAELKPDELLTHSQRVVHMQGDREKLAKIVTDLFGLDLNEIASKF
ncbi:MAG: hypothetical protein A2066_18005 [Bacteroidetes bacterium GWB2_41_8]|nr:MAG: hypothetical protein A2066_18005 [Bacteroidetes bacterium GWB2_41_8]